MRVLRAIYVASTSGGFPRADCPYRARASHQMSAVKHLPRVGSPMAATAWLAGLSRAANNRGVADARMFRSTLEGALRRAKKNFATRS